MDRWMNGTIDSRGRHLKDSCIISFSPGSLEKGIYD